MKFFSLFLVVMAAAGWVLSLEQEAWNRANGVGQICWTCAPGTIFSGPRAPSPFNGKDYPDPNPRSASDEAKRAAHPQHQREQQDSAARSAARDLSQMTCTGSGTASTSANAGTMSSGTSCRN